MGLFTIMERGPQSAGMYTVHEFRHSKPVLSLAKPSVQLIRQSQATWPSVGRAAWRIVSQFSLGPSSFLCTQCDTKCRVAPLEGLSSSSAVFCPKKLSRIKHQEGCQRDLALGVSFKHEPWHTSRTVDTPPCLQQDLGQQEGQEADGRGGQRPTKNSDLKITRQSV